MRGSSGAGVRHYNGSAAGNAGGRWSGFGSAKDDGKRAGPRSGTAMKAAVSQAGSPRRYGYRRSRYVWTYCVL